MKKLIQGPDVEQGLANHVAREIYRFLRRRGVQKAGDLDVEDRVRLLERMESLFAAQLVPECGVHICQSPQSSLLSRLFKGARDFFS